MNRPAPSDAVLATWEQAYGLSAAGKGVALAALALPGRSLAELRALTLGERDAALLELRAQLFGPSVHSLAACPACGDKLEVDFHVTDFQAAGDTPPGKETSFTIGRRRLLARAATCDDLLAIDSTPPGAARRAALVARCVRSARGTRPPESWSTEDQRTVAAALAACDPHADVTIPLQCASCGHAWSTRFDVVHFLWQEVDTWAQRMLAEVHVLARAYGWHEREVLAMSAWRRHAYLEMLRQ